MPIQESRIPLMKTGQGTTDANGVLDITFATPFPDAAYSVAVETQQPCIQNIPIRTSTGFRIKTRNFTGANQANVGCTWIAIRIVGG